jgi:hypothetical protein
MATYELEKVIEMWRVEKLTPEQAIGHMLQHLLTLREQLKEVENELWELKRREKASTDRAQTRTRVEHPAKECHSEN